jgi:hypothetical protein
VNQPFPPPPSPYGATPPSSNGVAITALVFGIVGLLAVLSFLFVFVAFVPGVAAIVLGVAGVRRAGEHPAGHGRGSAIAGIVCGTLATVASIAAFAIVALFVASSDDGFVTMQGAAPEDFSLSDQTCQIEDDQAVATGVLTNQSRGELHGVAITIVFAEAFRELGQGTDRTESELAPGESWEWEVSFGLDPDLVNTDVLECQVLRVERGRVVPS